MLAILIYLGNNLKLVSNGKQTLLGDQWDMVWKSEDSMTNEFLDFFPLDIYSCDSFSGIAATARTAVAVD